MEDFGTMFGSLSTYIRAELIILVPVLYFFMNLLKTSKVESDRVQLYTNVISIILSGVYIFSTVCNFTVQSILLSIFSSMTQGILLAGCAQLSASIIRARRVDTDGQTDRNAAEGTATGEAKDSAPKGVDDTEQNGTEQ